MAIPAPVEGAMAAAPQHSLGEGHADGHERGHRTGGAPEDKGCCQHLALVWIPTPQ